MIGGGAYLRTPGTGPRRFLPTATSSIQTVRPSPMAVDAKFSETITPGEEPPSVAGAGLTLCSSATVTATHRYRQPSSRYSPRIVVILPAASARQ